MVLIQLDLILIIDYNNCLGNEHTIGCLKCLHLRLHSDDLISECAVV